MHDHVEEFADIVPDIVIASSHPERHKFFAMR
jgi:hypothetical protein